MVKNVIPENVNVITGNVNEVFDKCHDKLLDIINTLLLGSEKSVKKTIGENHG